MNIHPRMNILTIYTEGNSFNVSNVELFNALADEVDFESTTDHELREIFFIAKFEMKKVDWKQHLRSVVEQLPFGLNQTLLAWDGEYPCNGCPDSMMEDNGYCHNREKCKAWEIYDATD